MKTPVAYVGLVVLLALGAVGCRTVALGGKDSGMAVKKAFIAQAKKDPAVKPTSFDAEDAQNSMAQQHRGPGGDQQSRPSGPAILLQEQ